MLVNIVFDINRNPGITTVQEENLTVFLLFGNDHTAWNFKRKHPKHIAK